MSTLFAQTDVEQPELHNHALPDTLPVDEHLLWQGAPSIRSTALHVFHVRKVGVYFVALMLWRFADQLYGGASALDATIFALWFLPVALAGLVLLTVLAALTAKTTIYTITSKRVVLRIGIALSMTVNLPFKVVEAAGLKLFSDGTGDIALQLQPDSKAAYAVLWPHARRWHLKHPQPSLRSIPNAHEVADILSEALANQPATKQPGTVTEAAASPDLAYPTAAE